MAAAPAEKQVHYIQGQHKSVLDRHAARTAEDWAGFLLPRLAQLPPNFTFLDLGCGPGSITTDIALRYPHASITGIDVGEKAIAHAKELAEQRGVTNCRFLVGDILKLDSLIELGSFDAVYCNMVLVHMQRPVEGLKAMKAAAKPNGGIVAACEASLVHGAWFIPNNEGVRGWTQLMLDSAKVTGADLNIGQKLLTVAMQAGWTREQIQMDLGTKITTHEERAMIAKSTTESILAPEADMRKRVLSFGIADEAKLQALADGVQEWLAAPDSWLGYINGQLLCVNR